MTDIRTITRDSSIILLIMVAAAGALGGWMWALGVAGGGGLALLNLFMISRLVAQLVAGESSSGKMAVGLVVKTLIGFGIFFLLLSLLHPPAVLVGIGPVVIAAGLRGFADLFAAPKGTQEA